MQKKKIEDWTFLEIYELLKKDGKPPRIKEAKVTDQTN